jgi:subtilisin family serine protease
MVIFKKLYAVALCSLLCVPFTVSATFAQADELYFEELNRKKPGGSTVGSTLPTLHSWMSPEIADAWRLGFQGQGTRITIVDDFTSSYGYRGNLGTGSQVLRHGEWVRLEAGMIAPSATLASHDFYSGRAVSLGSKQLNAVNLSYGMFAADGYASIRWGQQENSIISYARDGAAVIVKAAGNDAVAVGAANRNGLVDYLNRDLIGAQAAIFVGALDRNGTTGDRSQLARYSNVAGADLTVQNQFLSVGVRGDLTGLYGTSFAAPIVSGYAAVIGSKFTSATPTAVANQLLNTARTDTILGYDAALHGRGEASISRALAPASIQ